MTDADGPRFDATLFDGETAAAQPAHVTVAKDGLVIAPADAEPLRWRYRGLRRLDSPPHSLRLAPDATSLARLNIPDPNGDAAAALKTAAAHVFSAGLRRTAVLAASLAAVAGVVIGAGFFGAPIVAGPLARVTPPEVETQIGEWYFDSLTTLWTPCTPDTTAADDALTRLAGRITAEAAPALPITVSLVDAGFPNAFALPGGRVLVTDELLALMDDPDELAGVLAHEIAHVERRHVMAAMIREFGAAVAIDSLVGGGSGAGREIILAGRELSAFGHTRAAEEEADDRALVYLEAAAINPEGLAAFFDTVASLAEEAAEPRAAAWLRQVTRTHPDSRARAARVRAAVSGGPYTASLDGESWAAVKAACGGPDIVSRGDAEGAPVPSDDADPAALEGEASPTDGAAEGPTRPQ